jgi:crossover junction endonuclease MUS81
MYNMVEIHIDFREDTLHAELVQLVQDVPQLQIVQTNLELGDAHVVHAESNVTLLFERKTTQDLAASVKDGRYKEQKYRILSSFAPHLVTYVIEGGNPFLNGVHGFNKSIYQGVFMHTMYRDGVHILFVKNTRETAQWLVDVALKLESNPAKFLASDETYISSRKAKSRRIDNMTPVSCFLMQLCQIPGVSHKIAETIQQVYPNMRVLLHAMTACASEKEAEDMLCKMPLIGRKKAQTIVEFLLKE